MPGEKGISISFILGGVYNLGERMGELPLLLLLMLPFNGDPTLGVGGGVDDSMMGNCDMDILSTLRWIVVSCFFCSS